jgi:hypothetical protein
MKSNFNLLFYVRKQKNYKGGVIVYSGEMDHVIPWQTDQGIIWRTYVANTVKAFSKVVI